MRVPREAALASALVFPSFQMQESGLEGFAVDNNQTGAVTPFELEDSLGGFGVQSRWVLVHPKTKEPLLGSTSRIRFRLDDGTVYWEDVVASPGPLYLVARKNMGTIFDIGLGPFQSELQVMGRDTGSAHVRVFVPVTFNPLGLANTDQDTDGNLKYVFRAGGGIGADATFLAGSKLLIGLRAQGDYRYSYRAGEASLLHNRGDAEWILDAGIGVKKSENQAVMAMFTYQNWSQWDYDGPKEGVVRGNQLMGGRLVFRSYSNAGGSPPPPAPIPTAPLDTPPPPTEPTPAPEPEPIP